MLGGDWSIFIHSSPSHLLFSTASLPLRSGTALIMSQQIFCLHLLVGTLVHSRMIERNGCPFFLYMTSHVYIIFNLWYDGFGLSSALAQWGKISFTRDFFCISFSLWESGGVAWLFLQYTFSGCYLFFFAALQVLAL